MSLPKWQTAAGNIGDAIIKQPFLTSLQTENTATFSVISGLLPPGLNLASTGTISGTITDFNTPELSKFVVRASNSSGISDRTFSINAISPNSLKWITPAGFIDAGNGSEFYVINRTKVEYNFFAGYGFETQLSTPASTGTTTLYLSTLTNIDQGTPGVWREIESPGIIQGTTITSVSTALNMSAQGYPIGISHPVQFSITSTIVVFDQTPIDKKINYYLEDQSGQIPPGLTLDQHGFLSGYVTDQLSADFRVSTGGYDSDSYSSYNYDYAILIGGQSIRIVNRYVPKIYQFLISASDTKETVSREFKIIVVDPSNLKSDGTLTYASGPLSAQSGFIVTPEWLEVTTDGTTGLPNVIN